MGRHRAPKLSRQDRRKIRKEAADAAERNARSLSRWNRTRTANETVIDPPDTGHSEGR